MSLEIGLKYEDISHLEKFRKDIKSNVKIKTKYVKLNNNIYKSCKIIINCTELCNKLCLLGCVPNKSQILKFPKDDIVPDEFKKDFIRGYFDGDGCISIVSKVTANFTGNYDFLNEMMEYLKNKYIVLSDNKIMKDKRSLVYEVFFYGIDNCYDLLNYMYKDCSVYLERKYFKYLELIEMNKNKIYRGVYKNRSNKYTTTISINNVKYNLGSYFTIDEAKDVRRKALIVKRYILNNAGLISNDFEKLVRNKAWNSFMNKLRQHEPKAMSNIMVRGKA